MDEIKAGKIIEFYFALDFPGTVLASGKYPTQH